MSEPMSDAESTFRRNLAAWNSYTVPAWVYWTRDEIDRLRAEIAERELQAQYEDEGAAREIDRLRAENERLRNAMQALHDFAGPPLAKNKERWRNAVALAEKMLGVQK